MCTIYVSASTQILDFMSVELGIQLLAPYRTASNYAMNLTRLDHHFPIPSYSPADPPITPTLKFTLYFDAMQCLR